MAYNILILGASYGSLLGTKLIMAGHNVTLVCRRNTADLINQEGTEVRIKLKGEDHHRSVFSGDQPGKLDALTPEEVNPANYNLVALAMQEPQYSVQSIWELMRKIASVKIPCLSLMNMPPLPYLKRIEGLNAKNLDACYTNARIWEDFEPGLMSLCSPDPQAFRPPEEAPNILHVNLPTNFKAAALDDKVHNEMLKTLEDDIANVRLDGNDVPVKLRVHDSLFVPFAKWSMLLTGNYRCVTRDSIRSIHDAVHSDMDISKEVYTFVDTVVEKLGADAGDKVPFEKYANAAKSLSKPSSAARAILAGATSIERVDRLVQLVARDLGIKHENIDETVAAVDAALAANAVQSA